MHTDDANADMLTDVGGDDGYSDKSFAPPGSNFNNHYPLQDDVSDFLIFDIGSFVEVAGEYIRNYDPESNIVSDPTNWLGQLKEYQIKIERMQKEMKAFQKKIDSVDSEIAKAKQKIQNTSQNFMTAYSEFIEAIDKDIDMMSEYL